MGDNHLSFTDKAVAQFISLFLSETGHHCLNKYYSNEQHIGQDREITISLRSVRTNTTTSASCIS